MLKKAAFVVVVLALVMAVPTVAQQRNPRFVTGTALLGFVATITPPEVRCIGGEPTGLPFPALPCTDGTQRISGRSEVQVWGLGPGTDASVLPWLDGELVFEVNCNFNAAYRGPCWGTFEWDVPGMEGTWVGTWTSPVMDLMTYESRISMVGHGLGGGLDGKQLKVDGGSAPYDWYITTNVRIQ